MTSNPTPLRSLIFGVLMLFGAVCAHGIEFRILNWGAGYDDSLKYKNGKTIESMMVDDGALSQTYRLETGPLVLFREVKKEDKIIQEIVATLPLPTDLTQCILILTPTNPARTTYNGFWMDDSLLARPPGTVEFRNFSRLPVALKVNGQEVMLPAQGKTLLPFPSNVRRVPFQAAAEVDGKWEFLGGNPLPVRTNYRVLVMLRDGRTSPGQDTRAVDILSFYDPPPPKPQINGTLSVNP